MGSYVPSTPQQRQEMLDYLGISSPRELYSSVPDEVFLKELNLPLGKSELETIADMTAMADKNVVFRSVFRGAGAYNHYIPAIVKSVTSKEEFLTAYTPYQAEISQGILQSIFEYQTMICSLTGMDVSNASVYDGATAAAEAVAMCLDRRRPRALISAALNPETLSTIRTYCYGSNTPLELVSMSAGVTDIGRLRELLSDDIACVCVQSPNFFGQLEDIEAIAEAVHAAGAKLIVSCNPIALGILKAPADCGADIAIGEGQPLGMPLAFGGPYLGFMTCKKELMRQLPGRIVGETTDASGERAFVLTLQAREQHIRRERASSNICSNEALCALTAAVYLSAMGADGLQRVAVACHSKAKYLCSELCAIDGVTLVHSGEFFNEFVTASARQDEILNELQQRGILGGLPVEGGILWCCTELNSKQQIDELVAVAREVLSR